MTRDILGATTAPAQTSFLFPTAPAVQDGTHDTAMREAPPAPAATPATAAAAPATETKPAASGLSTQLIVALVTGAIALVGGVGTIVAKQHYDRQHAEAKARQDLRHEILTTTSRVNLALRATRKALVNNQFEILTPARARYDKELAAWYARNVDLTDRTQARFGASFALLIDAPSGMDIIADRCGVVVTREDHARGKDCAARLAHEVKVLTARQDAINAKQPLTPQHNEPLIPGDFTTRLTMANKLIDKVAACKKEHKGPPARLHALALARCPDLEALQNALNLRVNLVGVSQTGIKDALAAE